MRLAGGRWGLILASLAAARAAHATQSPTGFAQITTAAYGVDAGFGVERFRGVILGGGIELGSSGNVSITVLGQGGVLSARMAGELDRRIGHLGVTARRSVTPWLRVGGGVSLRTIASDAALQRWILLRVAADARTAFTASAWHGILEVGLVPIVAVSGLPAANLGLEGTAGIEFQRGALAMAALYTLERYDFPPGNTARRHEQITGLTVRARLRLRARQS